MKVTAAIWNDKFELSDRSVLYQIFEIVLNIL